MKKFIPKHQHFTKERVLNIVENIVCCYWSEHELIIEADEESFVENMMNDLTQNITDEQLQQVVDVCGEWYTFTDGSAADSYEELWTNAPWFMEYVSKHGDVKC